MTYSANFPQTHLTSHFQAPFDARTAPVAAQTGKNLALVVDEAKVAISRDFGMDEMSPGITLQLCAISSAQLQQAAPSAVYLGEYSESSLWAVSLAAATEIQLLGADLEFASLREIGSVLGEKELSLALVAVGMQGWLRDYKYCATCGESLELSKYGWQLNCPNFHLHFPRTDPAVIVAVTDAENRILLAHNKRPRKATLSILAGFVEPGESCESAVVREIYEEVGLIVEQVEYCTSQPWPYPRSLMLAYTAKVSAQSDPEQLKLQEEELSYAKWYTKADFSKAIADASLLIPDHTSVSHSLIQAWYHS